MGDISVQTRMISRSQAPCFREPHANPSQEFFPREQLASQTSLAATKCECSVKVFNSSVEIFVEKARAQIQIARDSLSLLLIAQNRCNHPARPADFFIAGIALVRLRAPIESL
jgi:hypothetical protein